VVRSTVNFKRLSFESIAHFTFAAAAAVILLCSWVLYGASDRATESGRWVNHTLEVITAFHEVNEQISRAEAAQRGYLLTTADMYLEERDRVLAAESVAVIAIKELTTDNKDHNAAYPCSKSCSRAVYPSCNSSCSPAHAITPSGDCATWLIACLQWPTKSGRTPAAARSALNL
jgi:hypothetical protein